MMRGRHELFRSLNNILNSWRGFWRALRQGLCWGACGVVLTRPGGLGSLSPPARLLATPRQYPAPKSASRSGGSTSQWRLFWGRRWSGIWGRESKVVAAHSYPAQRMAIGDVTLTIPTGDAIYPPTACE